MSNDERIARLQRAREFVVELQPGVTVTMRRPASWERIRLLRRVDAFVDHAVAWSGVTDRLIFGEGSDAPLPFDVALWRECVADREEWFNAVIKRVGDELEAHDKAAEARSGN